MTFVKVFILIILLALFGYTIYKFVVAFKEYKARKKEVENDHKSVDVAKDTKKEV